jgi:iron(III) transport system permease protein
VTTEATEELPAAPSVQPLARPPRGAGLRRRLTGRTVFVVVVVLVLLYLVAGPLVILVGSSFQRNEFTLPFSPESVWTLENYTNLLTSGTTYDVLLTTALFVAPSLVIASAIALVFAWLVERTDIPFRGGLFVLLVGQSGMPLLISSIAWSLLLNPSNGALNLWLRHIGLSFDIYTLPGMIMVQSFGLVPLTFLLVTGAVRRMNGTLENAAETSGARRWTIIRKINLPLIRPALLGAVIFQFVNCIESVDVPLVIGQPGHHQVFSTLVLNSSHPPSGLPDYGTSSATGLVLLLLAIGPLLIYNRVIGSRGSYETVTGKTFRPSRLRLGAWRVPALVLCLFYIVVSFLLPLAILLWATVQPYYSGVNTAAFHRISGATWTGIWSEPEIFSSLKNTLILGVSVGLCVMVLSLCVSWILVRSRSRFTWLLDTLAFTPHATPGVVIGLAVLILYLILPLPLYGTIWIIVIAQTTQYVSLGTRLTSGAIVQVQVSLEEAGAACGARMVTVWRRILLPLIRPAFFNGCLLVFMASIQNLSLPLILASPDNAVMSSMIWNRWSFGHVNETAVLSVLMTVITVVAAILVRAGQRDREQVG